MLNAARITRPVLVIHGLDDDIVTPDHAEAIAQELRRHHVPLTQLASPTRAMDCATPTTSTRRSKPNSPSTEHPCPVASELAQRSSNTSDRRPHLPMRVC